MEAVSNTLPWYDVDTEALGAALVELGEAVQEHDVRVEEIETSETVTPDDAVRRSLSLDFVATHETKDLLAALEFGGSGD